MGSRPCVGICCAGCISRDCAETLTGPMCIILATATMSPYLPFVVPSTCGRKKGDARRCTDWRVACA